MFDVVIRYKKGLPLDRIDYANDIIAIANDFDCIGYGNEGDFSLIMGSSCTEQDIERMRMAVKGLDFVENIDIRKY